MGKDKDLLILPMRHLTPRYRLVNAPAVSQNTWGGKKRERRLLSPQGCFGPDNLQSALIVSFTVTACPETCGGLYTFSLIVPDLHICFVQISCQRAFWLQ